MLIFVELTKADAAKEQAVRAAFKKAYGSDPVIATGAKSSTVTKVSGVPAQTGDAPEKEWVRPAVSVATAQKTLDYCLAA